MGNQIRVGDCVTPKRAIGMSHRFIHSQGAIEHGDLLVQRGALLFVRNIYQTKERRTFVDEKGREEIKLINLTYAIVEYYEKQGVGFRASVLACNLIPYSDLFPYIN